MNYQEIVPVGTEVQIIHAEDEQDNNQWYVIQKKTKDNVRNVPEGFVLLDRWGTVTGHENLKSMKTNYQCPVVVQQFICCGFNQEYWDNV